jgi:Flp pilus assembly protein TadB
MILVTIAGAGFGLGLYLFFSALYPAREPLAAALDRLGRPLPQSTDGPKTLDAQVGATFRRIPTVDRILGRLATDLRVLRKDPDEVAASLVVCGLVGLVWAPIVAAGAVALGIPIPWMIPAWLSVAGAVVAMLVPYRNIREKASEARAAFGHALSAYCDVCAMAMSAGRETYAAMFEAASAGDGWAFAEIRNALERGFIGGDKPWDSLIALGEQLGLDDLAELGATIALAGGEGAAVRDTVASKARSIRERLVTDAEKRASAATERMAVPVAMLMIGFLWFLTYPALAVILQQSHS